MVEDNERTLALMNSTGYEIQQDNGQRIYGPPPDWDGPAPKDTEVFIGKLPNDVYEYDLVPLFESCGKIYMLRIMQNFSGLNRGFAFVQYTTPEEADKAIRYLNNVEIRKNERIGVVKSRNNCRLYIGKLDQTMTREEIKKELDILTEDIVDVIIHKNDVEGLNNRGYAFVEYQTHKAAAKARRKLVPCKIKIRGHEIQVDWATPCHESGDSLSIQTSLLIKNLRESCRNDELVYYYSLRNKFKIIKFKRLPTQALISFNSKQEAEFAMRIYNEIKDTNEFNYFAEKDKRVEIVWLKNTMDLSLFSSSVNYPLPRVFPAPQCCQPSHQQRSNFLNRSHGSKAIGQQTKSRQSALGSTGNSNGLSNGNRIPNESNPGATQTGKAAKQSNCSNCRNHSNGSSPVGPNGNSSTHQSGSPTYPNGISNGVSSGPYPQASKCGQRFQAQVIQQNGSLMRPRFGQSSGLQTPPGLGERNLAGGHFVDHCSGNYSSVPDGRMFSSRPNTTRQHPPPSSLNLRMSALSQDVNPFTLRRNQQTNRHHAVPPPANAVPFTGDEFTTNGFFPVAWNDQAKSYKSNSPLDSPICSKKPLDKLNVSYGFGAWQSGQNPGKERKIVKRSTFVYDTNISEEDTCSLKSDPDSAVGSPDAFNCFNSCFNPIHSLNLADNFRSLTTENCQRLPAHQAYPAYSGYPVLQQ